MKKENKIESGIERHSINEIDLKVEDRATLKAMAKRYKVKELIDFLEGIVMKEQGPTIVARFYDD
jgi:hypothetical protein